jgi:hypothetical protein
MSVTPAGTDVSLLTSSITSTFERFKMALAIQSNCFSLKGLRKCYKTAKVTRLPSREVLATFGYRRVEIAEHVDVHTIVN